MGESKVLFSPITINGITLKNRIAFAPMTTNYASFEGTPNALINGYYLERARGGVGLIIMEAAAILFPGNKSLNRQFNYTDPTVAPDWSRLISNIHSYGAKVIAQLNNNGFKASKKYNGAWVENMTASPSDFQDKLNMPGRAMTEDDIKEYIQKCVISAEIAVMAGFDGIELHACHGDLQNQFLSPITNHRTDKYGGSAENRVRFLIEIIQAIREVFPAKFIISVRLSIKDYEDDGITYEDSQIFAALCEAAGADIISCSTGWAVTADEQEEAEFSQEGARVDFANVIKPVLNKAKIAVVGKLTTPAFCEEIVAQNKADLLVLGRQLICDPYWVKKAQFGQENTIRYCLYCREGCLKQLVEGHAIRCAINPFAGYEDEYNERALIKAAESKKVLVVGGGLAGMQAAIIAKKRNHDVLIVEKTASLGGQMYLAGMPPHKEAVLKALQWFNSEVENLCIPVVYQTEADAQYIIAQKPDVVILAIGSAPFVPSIKGIEHAVDAWQVLRDRGNNYSKQNIVIIGGGTVGCETANMLMDTNNIYVLEQQAQLCGGQEATHKNHLLSELRNAGVKILTECTVENIEKHQVVYKDFQGAVQTIPAEVVINACGQKPAQPYLLNELQEANIEAYTIGDASATGNFRLATRSAFDIAIGI